jgi:hypothetical protein
LLNYLLLLLEAVMRLADLAAKNGSQQ